MTRHRYTTAVCILVTAVMLAVTVLFLFGESLGMAVQQSAPAYVSTLFSTDTVHTLDIVVDEGDWAGMLENAQAKEYIPAHVVIDGESVKNVGLRTKGNSSLSSIASSDSDRYSFKIEFDHYSSGQTYKGLDKLALNNITQDSTYLKDYVSYQMMRAFEADAPLCSFIWITVNSEDWGLYLAVEGIEESFAARKYGANYGQLYKPDNMDMNAGRGEGAGGGFSQRPGGGAAREGFPQMPEGGEFPDFEGDPPAWGGDAPEGFANAAPEGQQGGFGGFGGRSNSDVALIYTDDSYESYSSIFDNAVFNPSNADKDRLIASLKQMNAGENLEEAINIEEVLRYFVVHNFVLNFDSYTGSMIHNYYLYEEDGVLSMVAWDYNLAFGAFSMGGGMPGAAADSAADAATTAINYPIDTPVSGGSMEDRPLLNQLLSNETYLEQYHSLFGEFIGEYFDSGEFARMYDNAVALISPYVEKDPSAFCTYDEFVQAQETLREFCLLRAESVRGQLDGSISSTSEGQAASDNAGFIDASHIDMDTMGSNMMGFNRARSGRRPQAGAQTAADGQEAAASPPGGFGGGMQEAATGTRPQGAGNTADAGGQGGARWTQMQGPASQVQEDPGTAYWLLGGALALLAAGLVFALRYRRR